VVLYSEIGTIEIDGTQMLFAESVSNVFERAGFETGRTYVVASPFVFSLCRFYEAFLGHARDLSEHIRCARSIRRSL
jgi:hypothetical protein